MFEEITKGEFTSNGNAVHCGHKCIHIGTDELRHKNAEFIAYCFNIQQRYDISKLEECVKMLDMCENIISDPEMDMMDKSELNKLYTDLSQLLTKIKK